MKTALTLLTFIMLIAMPLLAQPTNDLEVISFGITSTILADSTPISFEFTIKNNGSATVSPTDYEVQLYEKNIGSGDDITLGTVISQSTSGATGFVSINSGQTTIVRHTIQNHNFQTINHANENRQIYAVVIYSSDENNSNNTSALVDLIVFKLGARVVTIAPTVDVGTSAVIPISYNWRNNLSQSIYLQSEIGLTAGVISHMIFTFTGHGDIPTNIPVSLWLANIDTAKTSFASTNDWLPAGQFTPVWVSKAIPNVNQAGQRYIMLELETPFVYEGKNIALMSQRHLTANSYNSANTWVINTTGENRTLRVQSDNLINPQNPTLGTRANGFPHVRFAFTPTGTVSGTITLSSPHTIPSSGITITEIGTNHSVTSNSSGNYTIGSIPVVNQGVRASLLGFTDADTGVITDWVVSTEGLLSYSFSAQLNRLDFFSISGKVILDDTNAPAAGIRVSLSGYVNETVTTAADGLFRFENIWDTHTYTLTVSFAGYDTNVSEIKMQGAAHSNVNITLTETLTPPKGVTAQNIPEGIELRWFNPLFQAETLTHVQSNYSMSIGSNIDAHFYIAHRFSAQQLIENNAVGMNIYQVDFLPTASARYTVNIYTTQMGNLNPNLNDYNMRVEASNIIPDRQCAVILPSHLTIPENRDLWIAIEIQSRGGDLVAAADDGPMIKGFGNMMHIGGNEWITADEVVREEEGRLFERNWLIWTHLVAGERSIENHLTLSTPDKPEILRREKSPYTFFGLPAEVNDYDLPTENVKINKPRAFSNSYQVKRSSTTNPDHSSAIDLATDHKSDEQLMTIVDKAENLSVGSSYYYFVRAKYEGVSGAKYSEWRMSNQITYTRINDITIVVRSGGTGTPISGANIQLGNRSGITNTEGRVVFNSVALGVTIQLTVSFHGHNTYRETVTFMDAEVYTIHLYRAEIILSEGFEDGVLPQGWINIGVNDPDFRWNFGEEGVLGRLGGLAAYSESFSNDYGNLTPDNWLITPPINLPAAKLSGIEYWVAAIDPDHSVERIFVYVVNANLTTPSEILASGADRELLNNYQIPVNDTNWKNFSHNLPKWTGRSVRFAFRHAESYDNFIIRLDDIAVFHTSEDNANVIGWVVEESTEALLSNVAITLTEITESNPEVFNGRSDDTGKFTVSVKNNTRYRLTARVSGQDMLGGHREIQVSLYDVQISEDIVMPYGTDEADITIPPANTALVSNYPNPFNPETTIKFRINASHTHTGSQGEGYQHVTIDIYNIKGQKIRTLVNDKFKSGVYDVVWNGCDDNGYGVSSGVYLYRMTAGEYSETKRMLLLK